MKNMAKKKTQTDEQTQAELEPQETPLPPPEPPPPPTLAEPVKAPGKPSLPFKPGIDPVPYPNTVIQHPLYSDPQAAKPI